MNEFNNDLKLIDIEKLFAGKQFATAEDFSREFGCSKGKGYSIIRGIKSVSDISKLSGKVTKTDVLVWSFLPLKNNNN